VPIYAILFCAAIGLGLILSRFVLSLCMQYGLYDYPGGRKKHPQPTPHLGGIAIFASFWIVFLAATLLDPGIAAELYGKTWVLLLSSTVILVTGIVDDLTDLRFFHKITGQLVAAAIMIAAGFVIPRFHIPFWGSMELGWMTYPITVIWIVVLSNSINLIDGLDGLAGAVSVVVCAGMLVTGVLLHVTTVVVISLCLAGGIAGFLRYNIYPARLFMGDSGALFVGFMFSVLAVVCPIKSYTAVAMFVPLVAVGVPLLEVTVTFVRRTLRGQKFYVADNRHIYNYLLDYGLSQNAAVVSLTTISLVFTAFIPALFWFDRKRVFSIFLAFLVLLFVLFFILKLKRSFDIRNGERHRI
jgi:UDP-GlcNAc:undecaprenyl-phosphate GlcNAc-1-phosphate transferase